jgi:hypothetical protein
MDEPHKIISLIARSPYVRKCLKARKPKKQFLAHGFHSAGQKFPRYFEKYLEFFAAFKIFVYLFIYSSIHLFIPRFLAEHPTIFIRSLVGKHCCRVTMHFSEVEPSDYKAEVRNIRNTWNNTEKRH